MSRSYERDRYLESCGEEIPVDLELFLPNKEREKDCVLCGERHDNMPFVQVVQLERTEFEQGFNWTEAKCCKTCFNYTKSMLLVSNPQLLEPYLALRKVQTDTYSESEKKKRIQLYALSGKVPHDSYLRYDHLTTDDYYAIEHLHTCIFCNTKVSSGLKINAPVTNDIQLNGGVVTICRDCEFDPLLTDVNINNIKADKCPLCFKTYYVDNDEYVLREEKETSGQHMCPSCTHQYLTSKNIIEPYVDSDLKDRTTPFNRYTPKNCVSCNNSVVIDRTILPDIVIRNHVRRGNIHCTKCILLRTTKSNNNKIWVKYAEKTYLVIFKEGKYWKYNIFRISKDYEKPKALFKSSNISTDCVETTYIAFREAKKLLESQQLELWEEP